MGVTFRAAHGQAHPDLNRRVDTIADSGDAEFFIIGSAFGVGHGITVESGGDLLFEGGFRQEIAGQLFEGELVVGHVIVERGDDPVTISPDGHAEGIGTVTFGIGITGEVEPLSGPAFAISRISQETIDEFFVSVGRFVVEEQIDFGLSGRQATEIEAEAADECITVGFQAGF